MTHNLRLGVVCCYHRSGLDVDRKGIASLWGSSGVINLMPLLSLLLLGEYFKYDGRTSSILAIIHSLAEVEQMLAAEYGGRPLLLTQKFLVCDLNLDHHVAVGDTSWVKEMGA